MSNNSPGRFSRLTDADKASTFRYRDGGLSSETLGQRDAGSHQLMMVDAWQGSEENVLQAVPRFLAVHVRGLEAVVKISTGDLVRRNQEQSCSYVPSGNLMNFWWSIE